MPRNNSVRGMAFQALVRIENGAESSQEVLHECASLLADGRDRALLQTIVLGVLRHRLLLDWLINTRVHKPAQLQREILYLLRTALFQLIFLDRVPSFAVVNETVELTKHLVHRGAASLVNAVLRKFKGRDLEELTKALDSDSVNDRAIMCSHPLWLLQRWQKNMPPALYESVPIINNQVPPLFVRDLDHQCIDVWPQICQESLEPVKGFAGAARVIRPMHLAHIAHSCPGRFHIQDIHSQWTALQLELQAQDCVLDACCGRGGKLLTILSSRQSASNRVLSCESWALDLNVGRLVQFRQRLNESARFLSSNMVRLCCWDLIRTWPALHGRFSNILLDAPCSNTGVIRRHPEIKWRLNPADITRLSILQKQLLKISFDYLAPGGQLVYAVCSLEPEEGPEVIQSLLEHEPTARTIPLEPPRYDGCSYHGSEQGWIHLLPSQTGGDGFFVSKITKRV